MKKTILITEGTGSVGSRVLRRFTTCSSGFYIVNLGVLTYACHIVQLKSVGRAANYIFEKCDKGRAAKFVKALGKRIGLKMACLKDHVFNYVWILKTTLKDSFFCLKVECYGSLNVLITC